MKDRDILFRYSASVASLLLLTGLVMTPFQQIIPQLTVLLTHSATLIFDTIALSPGASFLNAGLLMVIAIGVINQKHERYSGRDLAAIMLMGSFAFIGKNILNIWPILLGSYLSAHLAKTSFRQLAPSALFATSLCPIVTDMVFFQGLAFPLNIGAALIIGVLLGFITIPLSKATASMHKGLNLYNVGLATGLVATAYVAVLRSFGRNIATQLLWGTDHQRLVLIFLGLLLVVTLVFALGCRNTTWADYKKLHGLPNQGGVDAVSFVSEGTVFVNIFGLGLIGLIFILLAKGPFNGATLCGIMTVMAFGGNGKNTLNVLPILLGIYLGSLIKTWNISDPSILLVALFGTSMAPLAQKYGPLAGVAAGFFLSSISISLTLLHGGANLYNTGFSSGVTAMIMAPICEYIQMVREMRWGKHRHAKG